VEPRNWGALGPAPLGWEAWLTAKKNAPPTCYLDERGRSALKDVAIIEDNPQNWELWGSTPLRLGRV